MFRRSLTLTIAGLATLIAIAVAVLVPVPYVILLPGPTLNTLGNDTSGQPLIKISGHQTYPTTGHLNMVTVGFNGGPGVRLNIFQALRGWLSPTNAVVPEVDLAGGRVVIELPKEIEGEDRDDDLSASRPREGGDP